MEFDYSKLIGRIIEVCGSRKEFAKRMDLSMTTINLKLNNKISWRQTEIVNALKILRLGFSDIQTYFFNLKVKNF